MSNDADHVYELSMTLEKADVAKLTSLLGHRGVESDESLLPILFVRPLSLLFHLAAGDPALGVDPTRMVHAQQQMSFYSDPPIGEPLLARAVLRRRGSYGLHSGYLIESEITHGDECLATAASVLAVLGTTAETPQLDVRPSTRVVRRRQIATTRRNVTRSDVETYADLSGDDNPIHLSTEVARDAGFPDIIVHGMLTFALTVSQALAVSADARPVLRRASARFSHVLHPGTEVEFSFYSTTEPGLLAATVSSRGFRLMRHVTIELDMANHGEAT